MAVTIIRKTPAVIEETISASDAGLVPTIKEPIKVGSRVKITQGLYTWVKEWKEGDLAEVVKMWPGSSNGVSPGIYQVKLLNPRVPERDIAHFKDSEIIRI